MKLWIVTSGEYSDYRIERIFTEQANAESFAGLKLEEKDKVSSVHIQEWETDQVGEETFQITHEVTLDQHGNVLQTFASREIKSRDWSEGSTFDYRDQPDGYVRFRGESVVSEKHAHKVAVETRQRWLAEQTEKGTL